MDRGRLSTGRKLRPRINGLKWSKVGLFYFSVVILTVLFVWPVILRFFEKKYWPVCVSLWECLLLWFLIMVRPDMADIRYPVWFQVLPGHTRMLWALLPPITGTQRLFGQQLFVYEKSVSGRKGTGLYKGIIKKGKDRCLWCLPFYECLWLTWSLLWL